MRTQKIHRQSVPVTNMNLRRTTSAPSDPPSESVHPTHPLMMGAKAGPANGISENLLECASSAPSPFPRAHSNSHGKCVAPAIRIPQVRDDSSRVGERGRGERAAEEAEHEESSLESADVSDVTTELGGGGGDARRSARAHSRSESRNMARS